MLISIVKEQYLSHCEHIKKLSQHTLRAYQVDLESFFRFTGELQVTECDRTLLQGYMRHLFDVEQLKESSVKRRFACLKALFRWLECDDVIQERAIVKSGV